jgi:hypothetical protein
LNFLCFSQCFRFVESIFFFKYLFCHPLGIFHLERLHHSPFPSNASAGRATELVRIVYKRKTISTCNGDVPLTF